MVSYDFIPFKVDREKIFKRLKIFSFEVPKKINELIEEALLLIESRGRYLHLDVSVDESSVFFKTENYLVESLSFARHCRNCSRLTLLAVTIGQFLEEQITRLTEKDKLAAMIFDAVGSEAAQVCAGELNKLINLEISRQKHRPTKRYSPGYGDLSLEVQNFFFKMLKLEDLGMRLNSSLLILPQKSITAFVGWRKDEK